MRSLDRVNVRRPNPQQPHWCSAPATVSNSSSSSRRLCRVCGTSTASQQVQGLAYSSSSSTNSAGHAALSRCTRAVADTGGRSGRHARRRVLPPPAAAGAAGAAAGDGADAAPSSPPGGQAAAEAAEAEADAAAQPQPQPSTPQQLRAQLKQLVAQQQVLQQRLDQATAAVGTKRSTTLRGAAASSTDVLIALLHSQAPQLTGQLPLSASSRQQARVPAVGRRGGPTQQQQQQQLPAHVPLLVEALNTISWHCKRQQLLPAEAARLQALMLAVLLPALQPHLHAVGWKQLARVVYALGSCYNSSWEEEEDEEQEGGDDASGDDAGISSSSQQQAAAAASAAWVERLLPLLPPKRMSAGALLAAWQGCALHEVVPPAAWLEAACWAAHRHLPALDGNDTSGLLQACAALDFSPPAWLMVPLVGRLQQQLGLLTPADLAGVLSALQDLSYRPGGTWLRVWSEVSSRHLAGMSIDQLCAAAGALAWTGFSPQPWWGRRLLAAARPRLPTASPDELLLLLHALTVLEVAPEPGWVHEAYCHLARARSALSLRQLADAAHVLGSLSLPRRLVQAHRAWLSSCLSAVGAWQGGLDAAAALSRPELLYMLYAAARLALSPGRTLLAASLARLHAGLRDASPAELAGCLSVFCYWHKRQQQQRGGNRAPEAAGDVVSADQLRDCLVATAAAAPQFSDEGLLQLLVTSASAGLPQAGAADAAAAVDALAAALTQRFGTMSLTQLAHTNRELQAARSSQWVATLLRQARSALAARA